MDQSQTQIDLAVTQSEHRIMGLMENKLDEHREAIEHRLDNQDDKLDAMQQDLSALVGTNKVEGLIQRNTVLLQTLVDKQAQDVIFQASITTQVSNLTQSQDKQDKDLRAVKWFVSLCGILGKVTTAIFKCLADSGDFVKLIGIILLGLAGWHWQAVLAWLHRLL